MSWISKMKSKSFGSRANLKFNIHLVSVRKYFNKSWKNEWDISGTTFFIVCLKLCVFSWFPFITNFSSFLMKSFEGSYWTEVFLHHIEKQDYRHPSSEYKLQDLLYYSATREQNLRMKACGSRTKAPIHIIWRVVFISPLCTQF